MKWIIMHHFETFQGGILLGPSALGKNHEFMLWIFPSWSTPILETVASLGLLFFLFLCTPTSGDSFRQVKYPTVHTLLRLLYPRNRRRISLKESSPTRASTTSFVSNFSLQEPFKDENEDLILTVLNKFYYLF